MVQLLYVCNNLRCALPLDVAIVMYTKQRIDFGIHWTTLNLQPGPTNLTHIKEKWCEASMPFQSVSQSGVSCLSIFFQPPPPQDQNLLVSASHRPGL